MNIVTQLNQIAAFISEQDVDEWIVPKLLEFYEPKIRQLAIATYGIESFKDGSSLPLRAFTEFAKEELHDAVNTYVFKYEHWRQGRDINPYLNTVLTKLSSRLKATSDPVKKILAMICPGCRSQDKREFLIQHGDLWKCQECSKQIENIEKMVRTETNPSLILSLESRLKLHKQFAIHSKKGYKCPECERFIPESSNTALGISCPYSDCVYVGQISGMETMSHPVGQGRQFNVSLQSPLNNSYDKPNMVIDTIKNDGVDEPDIVVEASQSFEKEYEVIKTVLEQQLDLVKRTNPSGTMFQKVLMYEAYSSMLNKYPEDMVSYLAHLRQRTDFPIQARIFQEYVGLVQDSLPYQSETGPIVSLLDPRLTLFEGISEFEALVASDGSIPNNTKECYLGGRKFKNYGPCFIGLLIDVKDDSQSLMDKVKDYSFVEIRTSIEPGTKVSVKHYRMLSHYQLKSMVFLQKVRKRMVSSVQKRLNKDNTTTKNLSFEIKDAKIIHNPGSSNK